MAPPLESHVGPGLTTVPITAEIIDRIRAGTADPACAAAVATALFTGLDSRSLSRARASNLSPGGDFLMIPLQTGRWRSQATRRDDSAQTAVFHVPELAQPLLRAARTFLPADASHTRPLFGVGHSSLVHTTAAACGIEVSEQTRHVEQAWQTEACCWAIGDPLHTIPGGPVHLTPPLPDPLPPPPSLVATAGRARSGEFYQPPPCQPLTPGMRQPLGRGSGARTLRLVRDHLLDRPSTLPRCFPLIDERLYRGHLVWITEVDGESPRTSINPDVLFALRLTDQPGPGTTRSR